VQVAIKHIDLPEEMRRAMARQAEAERERRAKVIAAEGEFQAAQRLGEAASIMAREPITIQLRYLQTLAEIATENNSTTIFPGADGSAPSVAGAAPQGRRAGVKIGDLVYELPAELIAQEPAAERSAASLLVLDGDRLAHARVAELPAWLRAGDLLV
jgi:hypothetical protein